MSKSSAERLWRVVPPYIGPEWIVRSASAAHAKWLVRIANPRLKLKHSKLRAKLVRFDEWNTAVL